METLVRDVPIDLDETYASGEGDFTTTTTSLPPTKTTMKRSNTTDSSAASGSSDSYEGPSSWSSSSGSFYDDLETSPIELGEKWYWHPNEEPEDKNAWNGESETGYLSRSSGIEEVNAQGSKTEIGSTGQIFLRTVWNRDTRGQDKVMAKRVQSNREIELLQYLNTPVARYDPWNPSPPLLSIVNDDNDTSDEPLAIFDPLVAYSSKPFATVEEVLDFVMQLLQGLVFLHENRVVHGDIHGDIVMMDKPSSQEAQGSRTRCVRYYLVDYTHASIVDGDDEHLFQEDLRDMGIMIDRALENIVPELSEVITQMKSLSKGSSTLKASQVFEDLENIVSEMPNSRIKASL